MKDPRDIIIRPVVSEKSYQLIETNVYTFIVHPDAAKPEIRNAIETIFDVKVTSVNTLNRKGKRKRERSMRYGRTSDVKRAVVTLKPGDSIDVI